MNAFDLPEDETVPDLGSLRQAFRPRSWAKWLTITLFGPLAVLGLGLVVAIPAAMLTLPDVPTQPALLAAGLSLVLGGTGTWLVWRSWNWLGHRVEIRQAGLVRRWRDRAEFRRWEEIQEVREWSVTIDGREQSHLSVDFGDDVRWEFDEEYQDFPELRRLIRNRGA